MNELALLAYHHHGASWTDWLAVVTVSSIVHAVIYGFVFRLMRTLTLAQAAQRTLLIDVSYSRCDLAGAPRPQRASSDGEFRTTPRRITLD